MTIRRLVRALSVISLLAPAVASANGGMIRFSGAIVESAQCKVDAQGSTPRAVTPRVSCPAPAGRPGARTENIVKVTTTALPPVAGQNGGPPRQHRIVTLEYL
ncbi:hypothetical protein [Achromobacter pestifer]|uniref:Type 1 fimbrial protein n=1 Tax=Achromobacter pestifer TaxID=1353889 RepID=A0A6S6YIQ0_9BURK|nr:hypothetical protein [Achromobacter pestifer]CAB3626547.1 hypothetical protein LMG3431_00342 [Achromobacter pestifer]